MTNRQRDMLPGTKAVLALCALMLCVICGGGYLTYHKSAAALRQSIDQHQSQELLLVKILAEQAIASLVENMESWAKQPVMVRILDDDIDHEIADLLETITEQFKLVEELSCVAASGRIIASTNTPLVGRSLRAVSQLREESWRGIRCAIVHTEDDVIVNVPIFREFDEREFLGMLRGRVVPGTFLPFNPHWWVGLVAVAPQRVIVQKGALLFERIDLAASEETYASVG